MIGQQVNIMNILIQKILIYVFFLNCFWWTWGPFFVFILLCRPSEDSLQWSTIPDGSPSKDWQSTVGWRDCWFKPRTAGLQTGVTTNEPLLLPPLIYVYCCSFWGLKIFFLQTGHVFFNDYIVNILYFWCVYLRNCISKCYVTGWVTTCQKNVHNINTG